MQAEANENARIHDAGRLLQAGRAAHAEAVFRARLAEAPQDGTALANLGVTLDAQLRHDEAIAAYRAALAIDPFHAEAHHNLGLALLRRGDRAAASGHLRRAHALAADKPQVQAEAMLGRLLAEAPARDGEVALAGALTAGLPATLLPAAAEALSLRARGFGGTSLERLRAILAAAPEAGLLAAVAGEQAVWLGRLEEARPFLASSLATLAAGFVPVPPAPPKRFDMAGAATALFGAIDALEAAGLAPFLNGGTALGCVREGGFIAHDSDVDLGLLPGADPAVAIEAIGAHPALTYLYYDVFDDRVIRIRFAEQRDDGSAGVGGDVFFYQEDGPTLWCGVQRGPHALRWADSRFALTEADFLGRRVRLPDPVDRYLCENYGGWRVPDPDHLPGFSAPNLLDRDAMLIRCIAMLSVVGALSRGDAEQVRRYATEAVARFPDEPALADVAERMR